MFRHDKLDDVDVTKELGLACGFERHDGVETAVLTPCVGLKGEIKRPENESRQPGISGTFVFRSVAIEGSERGPDAVKQGYLDGDCVQPVPAAIGVKVSQRMAGPGLQGLVNFGSQTVELFEQSDDLRQV